MKRGIPHHARWGLLVVTVVMGTVLVASTMVGYRSARGSAQVLSRAAGLAMSRAVHQETVGIWLRGEEPEEALPRILEELDGEGLRFLGLVDRDRQLLASAGEPAPEPIRLRDHHARGPMRGHRGDWTQPEPVLGGRRLRMVLGPPRGPMRWFRPEGLDPDLLERALVLEYEPLAARSIVRRAGTTLVLSLAAAAVLLGAAVVFWRLSLQAERAEAQLARDRRLKSLGQMSAVLGHELRNPLTSLKGHAQLLLERLDREHPARPAADRVVHEALRLESLTGQVLEFARTGAVDRSPTDPTQVARAAIERSGADPVELLAPDSMPPWPLDRSRLEQALQNLLENARSVSPDGEPIDLHLIQEGDRLILTVRDRGPGLAEEDRDRLFEPFFTRRVQGTGLGLAVTRAIVEGHGGGIEAANHPDGGAVFRIVLPRA